MENQLAKRTILGELKTNSRKATPEMIEEIRKKTIQKIIIETTPEELGLPNPEAKAQKEYSSNLVDRAKAVIAERNRQEEEALLLVPTFKAQIVKRKSMSSIKPLCEFEDLFINEQIAKGNTEATIKTYRKHFLYLYEFLTYITASPDEYREIHDSEKEREYGSRLPLALLELDDLEKEYRLYLSKVKKVSEQTIISRMRNFRVFAYYAMDNRWIEKRSIQIKIVEPPIRDVYTNAEIRKLREKPDIDDFSEYRDWVIVNYPLSTGNRRGSIVALNVNDILFEEKHIRINFQKNRTPSLIGLPDRLIPILREYIEEYRSDREGNYLENEPLFCNRYGQRWTGDGISKAIAKYCLKRGVSKTSIHLFRHTFAKDWITSGEDEEIAKLQKVLGHKSLTMVVRYSNLYGTDTKEAVNRKALINKFREENGRKVLQRRKG